PDPHDLAGIHVGRDAAGPGLRRGLRCAARGGHRRRRRHVVLHLPRHLLRAGVLRGRAALLPRAASGHEGGRDAGRRAVRERHVTRMLRHIGILALSAALTACTLAPRYEQPAAPVAATYENIEAATAAVPASEIGWKEYFPDPELQDLLARALHNN